ncbi:hypothetical protein BDZ94DRAFT_1264311 [Collybia nuda]|uniref:Uncharacterized protein n=1 Tax=Collybia nuda TaxID=64659 RepID=A0A9P5Y2S9_9AGAR|nr:hypothetical protein BDZ94DRAFT_1264311 [Collybia nuda]
MQAPVSSVPVPVPVSSRRLTARRGSVSASDPFGAHAHVARPLQSSSTLTIVRVTSPPATPPAAAPDPSSSPRRYSRRLAGNNSHQQPSPTAASDPTRLSFAFSSFGGAPSAGGPASVPRPSSPQHHRPSSPQGHRLSLSALPSKPRLSPEQLLELARSSTNPRLPGQPTPQPYHPASPSHSPQLRAHSPLGQNHTGPAPAVGPATFTPLPDDIYLPFIDRPSEVATLIASAPSAKLFTLLAQTFRDDDSTAEFDPTLDPSKWTYAQLQHHLTVTPRAQTPDTLWVLQARRCILAHSELIWERIKGALGVPPELDLDYDPVDFDPEALESSARSVSSVDTDEISDDHGRGARGHWDDWDAVMDSPVFDRRPQDPASPVLPISLSSHRFSTEVDLAAVTTASFSAVRTLNPGVSTEGEATLAPTPIGTGSLSPPHRTPGSGSLSPASPATFLSIEPILFSSSSPGPGSSANPPPLSLTTSDVVGLGLGDIQEGAEDEAEEGEEKEETKEEIQEEEDPDMISPAQIQGLRISTTPLGSTPPLTSPRPMSPLVSQQIPASTTTSSTLSAAYVAPSPISPLPPYPSSAPTQTHSRSGSVSSLTGPFRRSGSFSSITGPFKRTSSWGSIPGAGPEYAKSPGSDYGRGGGSEYGSEYGRDTDAEGGYDPVGDRAPGNPLFPGNFARLATGPTLVANNPALRSPLMPPPSRYTPLPGGGVHNRSAGGQPKMRTFSHGAFGDPLGGVKGRAAGRPLSWSVAGGKGGAGDYAVTVAESSAGGSERGEGS